MASNNAVWKDVIGYEGLYQVSDCGEVRSLARLVTANCHGTFAKRQSPSKVLTQGICGRDKTYYSVVLSKNGKTKTFLVHRLVAEAFIPNPENKPQINHKDENGHNNNVQNLEWVDAKYNSNYGTRNKRIGESQKGKYVPKGKDNPSYGLKRSAESREKMRQSALRRWAKCRATLL